ncbi:hypothetical protein C3F09_01520 [candidate division GN15 bacterium]|uniref:MurNAc-LAA domain-containing protein n=1 Tax=candidate division GN15 bacterium TaxID=2072418 RepID=A0A855XD34_9BACT|nr:MAG: hypothetical protein C3F09_01520 [candidate division GN15 bacterium]
MSYRSRQIVSVLIIGFVLALAGWQSVLAQPDSVVIVYPKADQTLAAVDSTYIIGHIPDRLVPQSADLVVRVNGLEFAVHPAGGFLAWIPLSPGKFAVQVYCFSKKRVPKATTAGTNSLASGLINVTVPQPLKSIAEDSLAIVGDYQPPAGDLALSSGQMLEVRFHGTPKCQAWFSIPGVVDSVPMSELSPRKQPYWGEALFGVGAVPESLMITGIYSGYYVIPSAVRVDSTRIKYHLSFSKHRQLKEPSTPISRESGYRITLNSSQYPFTVRFTDSVQVIRERPMAGYNILYQPKGVEALAVGSEGDWYRLRLSEAQFGYVNKSAVEHLPFGVFPPMSLLKSIRTYGFADSVRLEIPLGAMHPFKVLEDDPRDFRLQLFGVISNTDWIRYDFGDSLIELVTWDQPEEGVYELRIKLNHDLWGYDCSYQGATFCLTFRKPPSDVRDVRGKVIVLDPGHSTDPGSTGPTGYTESEANLALAKAVQELLAVRGAKVVLTRSDMRDLPLAERPAIAKANRADLFVSIHNNAQPDGVNPYRNNGVSTYYYHPHSLKLARAVQKQMIEQTELPDYGLYFGNLHVVRPTQYPAILVECAFIIIPEQEALLKSDRFRKQVAKAITNGIESFLEEYDNGK